MLTASDMTTSVRVSVLLLSLDTFRDHSALKDLLLDASNLLSFTDLGDRTLSAIMDKMLIYMVMAL